MDNAGDTEAKLTNVYRWALMFLDACRGCGLKFLDDETRAALDRPFNKDEAVPIAGSVINMPTDKLVDDRESSAMLPVICPRCAYVHLFSVRDAGIAPKPPR